MHSHMGSKVKETTVATLTATVIVLSSPIWLPCLLLAYAIVWLAENWKKPANLVTIDRRYFEKLVQAQEDLWKKNGK